MNEKENAWEALATKFADDVTKRIHKQLEACWKNLKIKRHNNLDASDRKERFRTDGGPPPAAIPDDPIPQTVGNILQRRFNLLPNTHDKTHPFLVSYLRNFNSSNSEFLSNKSLFGGQL